MTTYTYQIVDSTSKDFKEYLSREDFITKVGSIVLGENSSEEEKENYIKMLEDLATKHKVTTTFVSWDDEFQIVPSFDEEE